MVQQRDKIVLHACCAVCLGHSIENLIEKGYDVVAFFFNPNIYPQEEYLRRRDEFILFCEEKKYQYIVDFVCVKMM